MSRIRASVLTDLNLLRGIGDLGGEFPTVAHAVSVLAEQAQDMWKSYANGAPLPGGGVIRSRTGEYARSINIRRLNAFSAEVYSDLAYARVIEEGCPEYDMKKMLDSSIKVRVSKAGRRYLIIPFRWGTPGSVMGNNMPKSVHGWWKGKRERSHITLHTSRPSGTGIYDMRTRRRVTVDAWKYKWGDRLTGDTLDQLGHGGTKLGARMAGMVNFRKPGGNGGGAHSKYLTFRVMSEGSTGWIRPAQPGKWPARTVSEQMEPAMEEILSKALETDITSLVGGEAS
ncbi:hypothetical protein F1645_16475 (plasmid) [Novacetimonas hansenii]|uniref:Uncharacterized protein n=2 Tax=Acetobacteraceae TaxID=433 RepID=A0ABQ0SFT7_NOVHA|nr:hypothetical protein [Novacetimonas hansenii]GAN83806.1 hypothetical protein Gaha_0105_041 [Novacetimonas hansenii JCM 7643]GBQ63152.1 hypothetical protein AA0243_3034 [Novacetimonas hansenii NRIC 0243]GEC64116.1 hypothetical protein GHA01_19650 [Novacetimonas hansenii]